MLLLFGLLIGSLFGVLWLGIVFRNLLLGVLMRLCCWVCYLDLVGGFRVDDL